MSNAAATARLGNFLDSLAELRRAVDRLTKPTEQYLNSAYNVEPSLYGQLAAGVDSYRGLASRGVARSRPPIWVEAEDMLSNINLMVGVWPTGRAGSVTQQLQALANKAWSVHQTRQVRRLATIIEAWCDDIVILLNEQHTKYLSDQDQDGRWRNAACPACGVDTVYHLDSAGEHVRTPALRIVTEFGADCANCGHYWAPNQYMELATDLGCERPAGVLQ
ncbi:DUF7341 domain-containing protein [Mycolicibacterium mucogenicum]|uniref:Uncharacterized protein n=1 Tax=Mycolicibacterium mucogenicum DSM 44124 TaxID=1226753 RepID=A0A8H2JGH1_MYCMU|nr:hypothetical protein [Mycolicibacterium mucogenicum]KAB7752891.1 hypothetical protein MMUC44124_26555 [Mycolicibacterium mucogenicum DSM 44124]QPG69104.1 hypothetical protein C1S78_027575 [Mycolicibacterium mucogenicum DSM 44124]